MVGYVLAIADHLHDSAASIPNDLPRALEIADLAVRPHDTLFMLESVSGAKGLVYSGLDAGPVIGVKAGKEIVGSPAERFALYAVDRRELVGPVHTRARYIPRPAPEIGKALCAEELRLEARTAFVLFEQLAIRLSERGGPLLNAQVDAPIAQA
jgi:hypothetical protein